MKTSVAIVGTFDSKSEEHLFLKEAIESNGCSTITIDIGTTGFSKFPPDFSVSKSINSKGMERSSMVEAIVEKAKVLVCDLYHQGKVGAIISAGGGTGTFMGTSVMKALPLGVPKFMVSTVASRDHVSDDRHQRYHYNA